MAKSIPSNKVMIKSFLSVSDKSIHNKELMEDKLHNPISPDTWVDIIKGTLFSSYISFSSLSQGEGLEGTTTSVHKLDIPIKRLVMSCSFTFSVKNIYKLPVST